MLSLHKDNDLDDFDTENIDLSTLIYKPNRRILLFPPAATMQPVFCTPCTKAWSL
jgi:hypothetical protein